MDVFTEGPKKSRSLLKEKNTTVKNEKGEWLGERGRKKMARTAAQSKGFDLIFRE